MPARPLITSTGRPRRPRSDYQRRPASIDRNQLRGFSAASAVIDVAADAGLADATHFHRVFRQTYGYTPAQLRARAAH
jgi:AraC-like DNA-binding protein